MISDALWALLAFSVWFGPPLSFLFVTAALMNLRAGIEAEDPPKQLWRQVMIPLGLVLVIQILITVGNFHMSID